MERQPDHLIRHLSVDQLRPNDDPPRALFHISGAKLHDAHSPLTQQRIDMIRSSGITKLAVLQEGATLHDLKRSTYYNPVKIEDLGNGTMILVRDLHDEQGNVLVRQGVKMTKSLIDSIQRKGHDLFVARKDVDDERDALKSFRTAMEEISDLGVKFNKPLLHLDDLALMSPGERVEEESLDMRIEQGFETITAEGAPLSRRLKNRDLLRPRIQSDIDSYGSLRTSVMRSLDSIFHQIVGRQVVNNQAVLDLSTQVINALLNDKDLLMSLVNVPSGDDYLKRHTVNTCIISMQIATALGYDDRQVMEVAFGALFADVGMFKVPEDIRYKSGPLSPEEWHEVRKHPIYSIDYLSRIVRLPKMTGLIAYQSHERLDGSGYPKGRQGHLIHDYARIVAIADVYDALISTREWRPGLMPYKAMEELLHQCRAKKLDGRILRAFLSTVGLFPVGSWVQLNDGRVGQVIGLGEEGTYDRPCITLLFNGQVRLPRPQRLHLIERQDLKVLDVVDPADYKIEDPFEGF